MKKILYYSPRVAAVAYTCFISIFALDVFGAGYSLAELAVALFMHLIPTYVLIAATWLAWKKEFAGGIAFLAIGGFSVWFFQTYERAVGFSLISLPVCIIGALFLLNKYFGKKH